MNELKNPQETKNRIKNLVEEMSQNLPLPVKMILTTYRSTVHQFIDNLTDEQLEKVIDQAQEIIDEIRG